MTRGLLLKLKERKPVRWAEVHKSATGLVLQVFQVGWGFR
jgi:hypothetical protein